MKKYMIMLAILLLPLAVADLEVKCPPEITVGEVFWCDVITTTALNSINSISFDVEENGHTVGTFDPPARDARNAANSDYVGDKDFTCEYNVAEGKVACAISEFVTFNAGARVMSFSMKAGNNVAKVSLAPIVDDVTNVPISIIGSSDTVVYPTGDATPTIIPANVGASGTSVTAPGPCADVTCNGHGTCDVVSGVAECTCTGGYTGNNCETDPTPQPVDCTGNLPSWAITACGSDDPAAANARTYSFVQTCNGETSKCIYECPTDWELVNEKGKKACRNVVGTVEAVGEIMRGGHVGGRDFGQLSLLEKISAIAQKLKSFFS